MVSVKIIKILINRLFKQKKKKEKTVIVFPKPFYIRVVNK